MNKSNIIKWGGWHTAALVLISVLLILMLYNENMMANPLRVWLILIVMLLVFMAVISHGVTGSWKGIFIDNRNVISLSRFQMVAWTVLVLSAFVAAALWNILYIKTDNPLNITIDETLWMLMGISTTSLVASPLILSQKKLAYPHQDEMQKTNDLLKSQGNDVISNQGLVITNTEMKGARWSDLFTGEETGNAAHLDLSRMQMFLFTVVSILTYAVAIGHMLHEKSSADAVIDGLPKLTEGIIALIGISHTGYLASKALPHSREASAETPPPLPQANSLQQEPAP